MFVLCSKLVVEAEVQIGCAAVTIGPCRSEPMLTHARSSATPLAGIAKHGKAR
jgi:hypothetical protein